MDRDRNYTKLNETLSWANENEKGIFDTFLDLKADLREVSRMRELRDFPTNDYYAAGPVLVFASPALVQRWTIDETLAGVNLIRSIMVRDAQFLTLNFIEWMNGMLSNLAAAYIGEDVDRTTRR